MYSVFQIFLVWSRKGRQTQFYFGRVNNLMWISVFLLDRPLSVFLLERPESADYEDMYQTFYILTGCHDGAKYFTDLLSNMDRLLVATNQSIFK